MFFRLLIHLVFILVFLFGSTFSCIASITEESGHGHHSEVIQEKKHDDCCPEDGHKKQIEGKNIIQILQKKGLDIESFVSQNQKVLDNSISISYQIPCYHSPPYDRQSLFFTDTIKLLL